MTDDRRPAEDELLAGRIRDSMAHYTFDRPLPAARRRASPWRWPVLAAAALGGAAAAILAISLLGGMPRAPLAGASPTPAPSGVASPPGSPIGEAEAGTRCREPHEIQDSWIAPGETAESVADRLRQLPLIHVDRRATATFFLYADNRFTIQCEVRPGPTGELLADVSMGPREPHGGGLEYSGGASSPGSPEPGGQVPDLYMFGTAAPRFVRVEIVLADGGALPAWIGDGVWFAWWNEPISSVAIRGYAGDGTVTTLREGINFVPIEPDPTPEPTPWPGLPREFDGIHDACSTESTDVPAEWLRPGELRGQVLQRIRSLPLIDIDIRDHAAGYLFADSRFVVECRIYRTSTTDPEHEVARTLREDPGDGLIYSFGSARGAGGGPDGNWPADMLMVGSAAERFEQVDIVLEDGSVVPAVLQDGMWMAWWNDPLASVEVRGFDAEGDSITIRARLELARSPGE
jgi:hypothetical protein